MTSINQWSESGALARTLYKIYRQKHQENLRLAVHVSLEAGQPGVELRRQESPGFQGNYEILTGNPGVAKLSVDVDANPKAHHSSRTSTV